jgi:uncharacterized protein YjbJ (UPF0337 family)
LLDQQTKQHFQENWDQVKIQITQTFPGISASDIEQYRGNPDQLVSTIELKTGQPTDKVEQQLKQFAR